MKKIPSSADKPENPWYAFELRMYNQDIGRWFAPDPYGQFASPYLAMGNNPVSGVDPDGGYVAIEQLGRPFGHQRKMNFRREIGIEEFSLEEVQKRYDSEYKNLQKHFLFGDWLNTYNNSDGGKNNMQGYWIALQNLNAFYSGLSKTIASGGWMVNCGNGTEYLNENDLHSDVGALGQWNNNVQIGVAEPYSNLGDSWGSAMEAASTEFTSGFRTHIPSTAFFGWATSTGEIYGYQRDTYYADGSETHVYYDLKGNVTDVYTYGAIQTTYNETYISESNNINISESNNINAYSSSYAQSGGGGGQGNGTTVEQLLRDAMNMSPGSLITGDDIAKMNPKFSKAGAAIDNITKLKGGGVQVNLTFAGRMAVKMSPDYSNVNGAVFNLSNFKNKNGVESVHVQSSTATYGDKPINYYVNDNQFSIGGTFFSNLFNK